MSGRPRRRWAAIPGAVLLVVLLVLPVLAQGSVHVTIRGIDPQRFPQVTAYVRVADEHGRALPDLQPAEFRLVEDHTQPVANLVSLQRVERREPLYIVLAIDTSGSMHDQPIADARDAGIAFLDTLQKDDKVALLRFDKGVTTTLEFTTDHEEIRRAISETETLQPNTGATRLYKAAIESIGKTSQGPVGQRVVLLLSDGHDTGSELGMDADLSPEAVISTAASASCPLFTVAIDRGKPEDRDFLGIMQRMSDESGGISYVVKGADTAELTGEFVAIGDLLKWQYQLAYTSTVPADGKTHTLEVQVRDQPVPPVEGAFVAPRVPPDVRLVGIVPDQEVRGNVALTVEETRGVDLSRVNYLLDGTSLGEVTEPPFTYVWDTTATEPGTHTLGIEVIDSVGNMGTYSASVQVRDPLIVTIVRPAEGAELPSPYEVDVQVDSLAALERIEYTVDIVPVATTNQEGPYQLDLHAFASGSHHLIVRVYDQAGRTREASVNFTLPAGAGPDYTLLILLGVFGLAILVGVIILVTQVRRRRQVAVAPGVGRDTRVSMPVIPPAPPGGGFPPGPPAGMPGEPPTQQRVPVLGGERDTRVGQAAAGDTRVARPAIGDTRVAGVVGPGAGGRREPETELAVPVLAAPAWLVVKEGSAVGHQFPLHKDRIVLGRSTQCEVVIDDTAVSNRHAAILREGDNFLIQDLASTNGTFVAGERISAPQALQEGTEVRVGKTVLVFKKL
jgi:VWFA-related protein